MLSCLENDVSVVASTGGWIYHTPHAGGVLKVANSQGVAGAHKPRAPSEPPPSKGTRSRRSSFPSHISEKIPDLIPGITTSNPLSGSGFPSPVSGVGSALKSLANVVTGGELKKKKFPSSNPEDFDGGIIPALPKIDDNFRDFKVEMQKSGLKLNENAHTGSNSVPLPGPSWRHSVGAGARDFGTITSSLTTNLSRIGRKSSASLSSFSSTKLSQKQSENTNRCFQTLYWISKTDEKKLCLEVDVRSEGSVGRLLQENKIDRSQIYISASFMPIDLISQDTSGPDGAGARSKITKEGRTGGSLTGNSLIKALKKFLTKTGLAYVDLYVLMGASPTTSLGRNFVHKWGKELYSCRKNGFARAIGVGDFSAKMLELITREISLQYDREKEREMKGRVANGEADPGKSEPTTTGGGISMIAKTSSYDPDRPMIESHTFTYSLLDRTSEQIEGLKSTAIVGGLGTRVGGEFQAASSTRMDNDGADYDTYSESSDPRMGLLMFAKHPLGPSGYLSGKVPFRKVYLKMKREAEEKRRKKRNYMNPKYGGLGHISRPDGLGAALSEGGDDYETKSDMKSARSSRGANQNHRVAASARRLSADRGLANLLSMSRRDTNTQSDEMSSFRQAMSVNMTMGTGSAGSTIGDDSPASASSNSRTPATSIAGEGRSKTHRLSVDFDSEVDSGLSEWEGDPEWVTLKQLYENLLTVILEICFDRNHKKRIRKDNHSERDSGDGKASNDMSTRRRMSQHSVGTDSASDSHGESLNPLGQYVPDAGIHLIDSELYEKFLFELNEKQRGEKEVKEGAATKNDDNNKDSQGNSRGVSPANSRSLSRPGGDPKNRENKPVDHVLTSSETVGGSTTRKLSKNEGKPGDSARSSSKIAGGSTTRKLSKSEGSKDPTRKPQERSPNGSPSGSSILRRVSLADKVFQMQGEDPAAGSSSQQSPKTPVRPKRLPSVQFVESTAPPPSFGTRHMSKKKAAAALVKNDEARQKAAREKKRLLGGNSYTKIVVDSTGSRTSTEDASKTTISERGTGSKTRASGNIPDDLSKKEEQKREREPEQRLNKAREDQQVMTSSGTLLGESGQNLNQISLRDNPLQLPNPLNLSIESKVFVTPAMVALSWLFSKGCIPIIATKEDRDAVENMASAKLELTDGEMARLDAASDIFRYSMNIFDETANS